MRPQRLIPLLLLLLPAAPALGTTFRAERFEAGPGEIRTLRAADLTGDGVPDLLAFSDGPEGPSIRIWCATKERTWVAKPSFDLVPRELGLSEVYYFCLARPSAGRPAVLLAVDRKQGVLAFSFSSGALEKERVADAPALPFDPDDLRITVLDAAFDLDGDGEEELLLPSMEGYRILELPGGRRGGTDGRVVDTGTSHWVSSHPDRFLSLHWEIPRLLVADWDGDGIPDLMGGHEGKFLLFLQRKDGSFLKEARRLDLLSPPPGSKMASQFVLADVNGNGRVDLLVVQTPTAVPVMGNFSSDHRLFLNPRFFSPKTPGRLMTPEGNVRTSGTSINPTLLDFDSDGDRDLLVTSLEIDLGSQIRKDVTANYKLFLFDEKKGKFETDPYFDFGRPFPWEQLQRRSTEPVCFFSGDFDGDGKRDLLDIADRGQITILAGTSDTSTFSTDRYTFAERDDRPLFSARGSVENDVLILDLNGDGASDMLARGGRYVYLIWSRR